MQFGRNRKNRIKQILKKYFDYFIEYNYIIITCARLVQVPRKDLATFFLLEGEVKICANNNGCGLLVGEDQGNLDVFDFISALIF